MWGCFFNLFFNALTCKVVILKKAMGETSIRNGVLLCEYPIYRCIGFSLKIKFRLFHFSYVCWLFKITFISNQYLLTLLKLRIEDMTPFNTELMVNVRTKYKFLTVGRGKLYPYSRTSTSHGFAMRLTIFNQISCCWSYQWISLVLKMQKILILNIIWLKYCNLKSISFISIRMT